MPRPSPSLVISVIALFVALGGVGYAAVSLPKGSVGTKQLKAGAVTKAKISKKARKALKGNRGPAGATGPQGAAGPQGANGATGPPGPTFGETISGSLASMTACDVTPILKLPITVTTPSRILASASSAWTRNATTLNSALMNASLTKGGTEVAASQSVLATSSAAGSQRLPLSFDAVLSDPDTFKEPYVAQPGTYELVLKASASDGGCAGNSTMWFPQLTYVLLGTTP
jgi:hypothetical protein